MTRGRINILVLFFYTITMFSLQSLQAKKTPQVVSYLYYNCYFKQEVKRFNEKHNYENAVINTLNKEIYNVAYDFLNIEYAEYKQKDVYSEDVENIIVYFPGASQSLDSVNKIAINDLPKNTLLVSLNYPCYGQSEGQPSQSLITKISIEILKQIARKYDGSSFSFWGKDLGAAVALQVFDQLKNEERELKPRAMVLYSPWTSVRDVCLTKAPFKFLCKGSLLRGHEYNSVEIAPRIDVPLRVVYSSSDKSIAAEITEKFMQGVGKEFLNDNRLNRYQNFQLLREPRAAHESLHFLLGH